MMDNKRISCVSFNCFGYKSSSMFIENLCNDYDICFLCERWLKPSELHNVKSSFNDTNWWSFLKSSIDPEQVCCGRPDGGVGFICKENNGITNIELQK